MAKWSLNQRLAARFKRDPVSGSYGEEAGGFMYGYADGYLKMPQGHNARAAREWPNAYSAGYWEGFGDGC